MKIFLTTILIIINLFSQDIDTNLQLTQQEKEFIEKTHFNVAITKNWYPISFERDTVTLGYMKAKEVAEASHKEEIVQSWIEDLKTKNKWFTYEQVKNEITIRNKKGYLNLGVLETDYYPKYGKELVNNILIEIDVTWAKILNGK